MLTRIRWAIASLIAPDMAHAAPELRECLHQIFRDNQEGANHG